MVIDGVHIGTVAAASTQAALEAGIEVVAQQGGTYSGKTFGILTGMHNFVNSWSQLGKRRLKVDIVGQSVPHLKDGALDDYNTISDALGGIVDSNKSDRTYYFENGSRFKFLSVDKLGKAKGAKRDILFLNECNELDYNIVKQLMLRTDMSVILDWNPSSEFWFHDKVITDPDLNILFKRTTYKDNPTVTDKKRRDIESLKHTDPELYRVYALGLTGNIKGLIYPKVKRCSEFPEGVKKHGYGLDFGFTNDPTALIEVGVLHGEIWVREIFYETGLTVEGIVKNLKDYGINQYDEIFADSAEPATIKYLQDKGWNVIGAKKGPGSVNYGIGLLQSYVINATNASLNFLKESKRYKWKEKDGNPLNIPIDKFNHLMDALRYWASMKLGEPEKRHRKAKSAVIG